MNVHANSCDCYECKADPYLKERKIKYNIGFRGLDDNADKVVRDANYYLDSTLVARKPVKLMKSPDANSAVIMEFNKGGNVGKIYSWVVKNGQVWWEVDWFSGKHAGWVKHDPALFDADIAQQTSSGQVQEIKQAAHNTAVKEMNESNPINAVASIGTGATKAISGIGDLIGDLGGNIKWVLLFVVFAALALGYFKFVHK